MKVKVKSVFVDKNTKERYKINYEFDVSKERYEEIKKYVEIVETKKGIKVENN